MHACMGPLNAACSRHATTLTGRAAIIQARAGLNTRGWSAVDGDTKPAAANGGRGGAAAGPSSRAEEDASPPRRRRQRHDTPEGGDSDASPPRRRAAHDDVSPPRRRCEAALCSTGLKVAYPRGCPGLGRSGLGGRGSVPTVCRVQLIPVDKKWCGACRQGDGAGDADPPRRRPPPQAPDASPPRRGRHDTPSSASDSDASPPRRPAAAARDADLSPPRKRAAPAPLLRHMQCPAVWPQSYRMALCLSRLWQLSSHL